MSVIFVIVQRKSHDNDDDDVWVVCLVFVCSILSRRSDLVYRTPSAFFQKSKTRVDAGILQELNGLSKEIQ